MTLGVLNVPMGGGGGVTSLGLSPKKYQFFDGFPKTNLYLIELITKGDFNNKNRSVSLAVTFVKK